MIYRVGKHQEVTTAALVIIDALSLSRAIRCAAQEFGISECLAPGAALFPRSPGCGSMSPTSKSPSAPISNPGNALWQNVTRPW